MLKLTDLCKPGLGTKSLCNKVFRRFSKRKRFTSDDLELIPDILEYRGEFGSELVLFLPFCNWLSRAGLLRNRRIRTYFGMRCFYQKIDCLEILEKSAAREWIDPRDRPRWLPIKNEHDFDHTFAKSEFHVFPDLRKMFLENPLSPDVTASNKPLLVIHNKFNDEWNQGPVNFISLEALEKIFLALQDVFQIIYIRHGMGERRPEFSDDHNSVQQFGDSNLLTQYPSVYQFDELYRSHCKTGGNQDLNTFKNTLYSRCKHFISSQGGGAHHIAMFSGSLLTILHRQGLEEYWAYGEGYYDFMTDCPPTRIICRTEDELISVVEVYRNTRYDEGKVTTDPAYDSILYDLSPSTMRARPATKRIPIRGMKSLIRWTKENTRSAVTSR